VRPAKVRLRVDRVVLDGVALEPRAAARFRAGLEGELSRLLADGGVPGAWRAGGAQPSSPAAAVASTGGGGGGGPATPAAAHGLGVEVARSVYGGFGR
jgi:hypothetical protein